MAEDTTTYTTVHQHCTFHGAALCCHCDELAEYPSSDGWLVCFTHRGM